MSNYLLKGIKIKEYMEIQRVRYSLLNITEFQNECLLRFDFDYLGMYGTINIDAFIPNDDTNEILFNLGYIYKEYNIPKILKFIEQINNNSFIYFKVDYNQRLPRVIGVLKYKTTIDRFDGKVFCHVINDRLDEIDCKYHQEFINLMGVD